ncbi:LCP family protein [Amycolatopsis regifaucium]|uniref:LytTR family transcriptional regulator n=1 Tax=Amycolatopsis regifaucium TaxID=546365 RepID=A0A154MCP2_9PSEU|nr:LCP family protein [Amycolatopsis regifaucium]KZB82315.1 LytTR family transcriptional regulator [Amycolatopsis regifaucium]OKA10291.1 LytTR family transcriptional regulator [Amycolatopsis regifaucium]SFG89589.1 cell envelope-related function transcriptional attenuator common domain-containing protein [Amycolatopsis regifaucium]
MTEWPGPPNPARRGGFVVFARRGVKVVLSLISITILALTWWGWQLIGDQAQGFATTNLFEDNGHPPAKPLDGAIDILLVGQDSRTDAQGNPLPREVLDMLHAGNSDGERQTDTMILVHIPQNGEKAIAISFPRDSWVEITGGFGKHKLNSAYVYAYNDTSKTLQQQGNSDLKDVDAKAKDAGRKNLIATLEKFIGKPKMIDRYAEVNLASFYEITKAIGGVEVCLNGPVKERKSGVDLPAGRQTVEGVQALAFVRQRYDLQNGDLDRIARQQAFLSGLANKVLSSDVLTNPAKISNLIEAVKKSVVLSAGWDLPEFAAQMRGLSSGNVEFHTIPTQGDAIIGGAAVLRVDPAQVQAEINRLTSDGQPPSTEAPATLPGAEAVTVELFDGSGSPSLASDTRNLLQGKGFKLAADTKLSTRNSTVIRYAPGDEKALDLIKQVFGTTLLAEADRDVAPGKVRVLLGKDFKGAPAGATTAPPKSSAASKPAQPPSSAPAPTTTPIVAGNVPCVN